MHAELWSLNDEIRAYLYSRRKFQEGDIYVGKIQQRLIHLLRTLADV